MWWAALFGGCEAESAADPCGVPGNVCTWMGLPQMALASPVERDRLDVGLYWPLDLSFGPDGTGYVADFNNHRVLQVSPAGWVTLVTGTTFPGDGLHNGGGCDAGCDALATEVWHPSQIVVDPVDPRVVYTVAWHDHRVVSTDLDASVTTWELGDGRERFSTDPVSLAFPSSMVIGDDGMWYVADQGNQVIRGFAPDGTSALIAGRPGVPGYAGDGGPAAEALLRGHADWVGGPTSKLVLRGRTLYAADSLNGVIRAIDLDAGTIDRVAGRFVEGASEGSLQGYEGDGGDALEAVFAGPRAVAFGPDGEMYVADSGNNCIRVVEDGIVSTFAGRCGEEEAYAGDRGPALNASFAFPVGVVVDAAGDVYISDSNNQVIRRVVR